MSNNKNLGRHLLWAAKGPDKTDPIWKTQHRLFSFTPIEHVEPHNDAKHHDRATSSSWVVRFHPTTSRNLRCIGSGFNDQPYISSITRQTSIVFIHSCKLHLFNLTYSNAGVLALLTNTPPLHVREIFLVVLESLYGMLVFINTSYVFLVDKVCYLSPINKLVI